MVVIVGWLMAEALAGTTCATPSLLEADLNEVTSVAIRLDGDVSVVTSEGAAVRIEHCGGSGVRMVRKGAVLELHARRAVDSATVQLPAQIARVAAYEHEGPLTIAVPAEVAVVSSQGALQVQGAASLRVSWHEGDVAVSELQGDLLIDRLTGSVRGQAISGHARLDGVTGPVSVQAQQGLLVDGQQRTSVTLAP